MNIQARTPQHTANSLLTLQRNALGNERASEISGEPKDTMTFRQWMASDAPANPKTVAAVGGGAGLAGAVALAGGILTQSAGLALGGLMTSMVGFTVAYAANKAS